jgi:hypothetical protein
MPGSAAVWIARRLPVDDDAHREELAGSVADLVAAWPRCERAREAASLAGLWLQLWGRREGLDDARQAVRQGLHLGGVLLAFVAAGQAWSRFTDGPGLAAAALASVAAVLAAGGWRGGAMAAAAGSTVAAVEAGVPAALTIVAALALLAGDRFGARHCRRGLAAGAASAGGLGLVATSAPDLVAGAIPPLVACGAVGLLLVGRFDPRFAVAATTVWVGIPATVGGATSPTSIGLLSTAAVLVSAHLSWAALRRSFSV